MAAMITTESTAADLDALRRSYELGCKESEAYRSHLESIEAQSGWREAAESASYHLQVRALALKCFECPPSSCRDSIDVIDNTKYGSRGKEVRLRRRLLGLGISLFEPDPLRAIERAESTRRNARVVVGEKKAAHPVA
jgi:hypothetical protein